MGGAMIGKALELFVERVPLATPSDRLRGAQQLLVIDCCSRRAGAAATFAAVSRQLPLQTQVIAADELDAGFDAAAMDQIWILIDDAADISYAKLLSGDVAGRGGCQARLVAVGHVEGADPALQLERRHLGAGPAWRRRRDISEGASLAAGLLAEGGGS